MAQGRVFFFLITQIFGLDITNIFNTTSEELIPIRVCDSTLSTVEPLRISTSLLQKPQCQSGVLLKIVASTSQNRGAGVPLPLPLPSASFPLLAHFSPVLIRHQLHSLTLRSLHVSMCDLSAFSLTSQNHIWLRLRLYLRCSKGNFFFLFFFLINQELCCRQCHYSVYHSVVSKSMFMTPDNQ